MVVSQELASIYSHTHLFTVEQGWHGLALLGRTGLAEELWLGMLCTLQTRSLENSEQTLQRLVGDSCVGFVWDFVSLS
jgi:hypothetical protein